MTDINFDKITEWKPLEFELGLEEARSELGIRPNHDAPLRTTFHRGAEITSVELVSWPTNPYKDMVIHALQTWGTPGWAKASTWNTMSPEYRMKVVYAILTRNALPLALELPDLYFEIRNISRIAFDQIVRARIGVTVSSLGTRNNDVSDIGVMVPPRIYDNPMQFADFQYGVETAKRTYHSLIKAGTSWEDARYVIPQGILHGFGMDFNYAALSQLLSQRMMFCMEFSTVATAWKMWAELRKRFAVLAEPIRPACDAARACTFRAEGRIGEAFSNDPHSGCGRWPDPNPIGHFPGPSTEPSWIDDWTGGELFPGDRPNDWARAFEKDKDYFVD